LARWTILSTAGASFSACRSCGGIAHYGNAFGVATIGGEVAFDDAYALNPLATLSPGPGPPRSDLFGKATGVGNPVLYVAQKPGRDGIHGATMARPSLTTQVGKRPTVQVGDPFLEKLLLEACLEASAAAQWPASRNGAAGLTSSSCEMAARAAPALSSICHRAAT